MLEPFVLVIDDAQRAEMSLESGLLAALIAQTPPSLRLVLVGTTALETRIPRFVLSHPDAVVGAEVLAFDAREVADLAIEMTSVADAVSGPRRDGGLADRGSPRSAQRVDAITRVPRARAGSCASTSGTSSSRPSIRSWRASSWMRPSAASCRRAWRPSSPGRPDAARLLEQCRRLGLFLDRHDGPSGVEYRWHALFARHCRELLAEEDPERLAELQRHAARLLAEARPLDAVAQYLEVGDGEAAAGVIESEWVRLVMGSAAGAVDRACLALPPALTDSPTIQLMRACAREVLGEHKAARELFERAEAAASDDRERAAHAERRPTLLPR